MRHYASKYYKYEFLKYDTTTETKNSEVKWFYFLVFFDWKNMGMVIKEEDLIVLYIVQCGDIVIISITSVFDFEMAGPPGAAQVDELTASDLRLGAVLPASWSDNKDRLQLLLAQPPSSIGSCFSVVKKS